MSDKQPSVFLSLRGKTIVIIGGDPREPARLRLEQEFNCKVAHFATRESDPSPRLFAKLASSTFDLVVWVFGRSRHAHGDYVRDQARHRGVPFLVLRSFPHPNRLWHELANQHLLVAVGSIGGAR